MSHEFPFRLITAILLLIVLSISIYYRHRAEQRGGALDRSQGQRLLVLLRLLGLVGLLPLFWLSAEPSLGDLGPF